MQVREAYLSMVKHLPQAPRQGLEEGLYYCVLLRGRGTETLETLGIGPPGPMYNMEVALTISNLPFGLHCVSRDFRVLHVWTPAEDGSEKWPLCGGRKDIPFPQDEGPPCQGPDQYAY